jgi:hypothetical protein
VSVPGDGAPRQSRYAANRWGTIRYAISSNARTARLCLIMFVAGIPAVAVAIIAILRR